MGKTGQSRIDDVTAYLTRKGMPRLARHLIRKLGTVSPTKQSQIGEDLSLDTKEGTSDQRQALRSLLLCQRMYLSDMTYRPFIHGVRVQKNMLPQDWKARSLAHWGELSEAEIIAGIKVFTVWKWSSGIEVLADTAKTTPSKGKQVSPWMMSRNLQPFPGTYNCCYVAVMSWLFESGLTSYSWFCNSETANGDTQLTEVFGLNDHSVVRSIWDGTEEFTLARKDELERPPAGYIVHVYNKEQWRGHWLVSNGDGTFSGCNNDKEGGRINPQYDNRCSLPHQLLSFTDKVGGKYGMADVINPLKIPNRMGD